LSKDSPRKPWPPTSVSLIPQFLLYCCLYITGSVDNSNLFTYSNPQEYEMFSSKDGNKIFIGAFTTLYNFTQFKMNQAFSFFFDRGLPTGGYGQLSSEFPQFADYD
jgi:hypothetical protein